MKTRTVWIVLLSVIATLVVVFLALNLSAGEKHIEEKLERLYATDAPQFRRSMDVLLGPPFVEGNRTQVLVNGDEIFPAMLEAIRAARSSITFETYIYWSGTIGREFADALTERARAGVKVHVLLDWIGSVKMEDGFIDELERAGVEVERYHEPHWSNFGRLNNRTHRKLLVVDGTVGFTGGVGIADQWRGNAQDGEHWRDTHFRIEGPVVAQIQAVFMDNWIKSTGNVLHGELYFPALQPRGDQPAQMFSSSPTGGSESMRLMYLMAITAAERSIHLSASYFVPDELAIRALAAAARRGVKVQIILPGQEIDAEVVRRASRSRWGELLEAGVEIGEYQDTMFHCKVLVVDTLLVSVGSTNFDNRSLSLNDEANLNVLHAGFAERQIEIFEQDLRRTRPVTLQAWERRPWQEKLVEQLASLLGSQL
ncbi:cardiolipin synthase [Methylibium sp.]|uniref:cardiolipin synthase n=1 Tax=Methylibium sp. TaxID=2067992 RepID=UPI00184B609A|nr:cardiolipin synthase [Methylibium sp.]MBA3588467.1 cardiolipin synthase [Methylibium sp.]